jgi:threonine dehydratase
MQYTGSFKVRGAFNRILSVANAEGISPAGLVAASGGNAGLAVAYVARKLSVRAEVYIPQTTPQVKLAKLRALNAIIYQEGQDYADAREAAEKRAAETGATYCDAYDQPEIAAGHGTVALELLEEAKALDTVLIAVGGGGLLAGVAVALKGHCNVIGVEPNAAPTLHAALKAGQPVDVEVAGVASDSLGARRIGTVAYYIATQTGVCSILVSDEAIVDARRVLWERHRVVVEHGTAVPLAALLSGFYAPQPDERIGIVLCGGNTDPRDLTYGFSSHH